MIDSFDADVALIANSMSSMPRDHHKLSDILQTESLVNASRFYRESILHLVRDNGRYKHEEINYKSA